MTQSTGTLARIGRIAGIAVLVIAAMVALGPLLWTVTYSWFSFDDVSGPAGL